MFCVGNILDFYTLLQPRMPNQTDFQLNFGIPASMVLTKGRYEHTIYFMKFLDWSPRKNELLKKERGISFEEIAYLIENGQVIGIEENPGRPNQNVYILEIDGYAVIVPYVEDDQVIFLKTAFPSRKYTRKYGQRRSNDADA
jgi:hypothetical protein